MIGLHGFAAQLLIGAKLTIFVAIGSLILGLIFGLIGAAAKLCKNKFINLIAGSVTSVVKGFPELIVLFTVYFGGTALLTKLFHYYVDVNALVAGIFALSLIFGAYATETLKGAFLAVPKGQVAAAQVLGLTKKQTFFHILLPQVWRHALPGLSNLWLVLLKDTALISLIGLADLMNKAQLAASETSEPFTFYCAAGLIYLIMTTLSYVVIKYFIKKVNKYEMA
ncbi:MAG: ABC transporter permease subunit [Gammaproteobacteria bacterium]|jgi:His/Glu/Gln/Arg/opine family amino acid ABC transporter permease subunit